MKKLLTLLILGLFLSSSAFAAVGVKSRNSDGTTSGPYQATDIVVATGPTVSFDGSSVVLDSSFSTTPLYFISATADTLSTTAAYNGTNSAVTAAKTNGMFVLSPTALAGVGSYILSLPGTYSTTITGLTYTFTCATGTALTVRTASATDSIIYYGIAGSTAVTSPASSGSTITIVGQQGAPGSTKGSWYVKSVGVGADKGNSWTSGSF